MNDSSLPHGTRPTLALSVTGLTKHYDSGFTLDDVTFDKDYVNERLEALSANEDLSRYVL